MRPVTSTTTTVRARDGTAILVRRWGTVTPPWAHVILVHGIAEHSGRYEDVGDWLAAAGLGVTAYDQRGFGESGGRRAWIDRWSRNHDDLEERIREVRARAGDRPVVVYGHSLGGLLALGYAVADEPRSLPDALVLSAPALDTSVPAWKRTMARILDRAAPTMSLKNDFDGAVLSRDPAVGERYLVDPLNQHRTTVHFGAVALAEGARVRAAADRLTVPALVYHGEADELVPPPATEPLAAVPAVTRRTYPQLRHESHNEPEGREVVDDVVAWLHATVGDRGPVLESDHN